MINEIVRVLFKIVFTILRWFFNLLLFPLKPFIWGMPIYQSALLERATDFINDYFLRPLHFGKQVFINLTGFPQELITVTVTFFSFIITFVTVLRVVAFIQNCYALYKKGGN